MHNDLDTLEDETIAAIANMMWEQFASDRLAFCSSAAREKVAAALAEQKERQRRVDNPTHPNWSEDELAVARAFSGSKALRDAVSIIDKGEGREA